MQTLTHPHASLQQSHNAQVTTSVLEELIARGVTEFCLCAGARAAPLVYPLVHSSRTTLYYWPEERSAAFFALGRIKATGKPVAVVTTSGTAVAELLPAVIEAYYTALPLVLVTADRPKRFRGKGAPQSIEQVGLFSHYVDACHDIDSEEKCSLTGWAMKRPIHVNVCLEEPDDTTCQNIRINDDLPPLSPPLPTHFTPDEHVVSLLRSFRFPFAIVGALPKELREAAVQFFIHLNIPLYAEAPSHIREDERLSHLMIRQVDDLLSASAREGYPIDGLLRIGGVPTVRAWRDIENLNGHLPVYSISEQPFSGLSWGEVVHTPLAPFFAWGLSHIPAHKTPYQNWKINDDELTRCIAELFQHESGAEESLIHTLSHYIPEGSTVYLGNSLPIRSWDFAATYTQKDFHIGCNRGANGIDGQLSTFLGFCAEERDNWGIVGDLTALYDLAAPWITKQRPHIAANIVVINNGGAAIFKRMFAHPAFQNTHALSFEPIAKFWGWDYELWDSVPKGPAEVKSGRKRLIELVPSPEATERLLKKRRQMS